MIRLLNFNFTLLLILLLSILSCAPSIETLIEKKEYSRAEQSLRNSLLKDSLNIKFLYTLCQVQISDYHPSPNGFAAYSNIKEAERLFALKNPVEIQKYNEIKITKKNIELVRSKIIDFTATTIKKRKNISEAEQFLERFEEAPLELKFEIEQLRDSLELENAYKEGDIYGFQQFLKKYPNSIYRTKALQLMDSLSYKFALESGSVDLLKDYLKKFPDSKNAEEINDKLYKIAFEKVIEDNTLASLSEFVNQYPNSPQIYEAKKLIEVKEYELAQSFNTLAAYNNFIKNYPESKFVKEAVNAIEFLEFEILNKSEDCNEISKFLKKYPKGKYIKQASQKYNECIYTKNIILGDWLSYLRFYHFFEKHPQRIEIKDSIINACKKKPNLQLLDFCAKNSKLDYYQTKKYYELITNDGEKISFNRFKESFPNSIEEKTFLQDFSLSVEFEQLKTPFVNKDTDRKKYTSFIKKSKSSESTFVALQRLISNALKNEDYKNSEEIINQCGIDLSLPKVKNLISILKTQQTTRFTKEDFIQVPSDNFQYSASFFNTGTKISFIETSAGKRVKSINLYNASKDNSQWYTDQLINTFKSPGNDFSLTPPQISMLSNQYLVSLDNKFFLYNFENTTDTFAQIYPQTLARNEWRGDGILTQEKNTILFAAHYQNKGFNTSKLPDLPYHGDFQIPSDLYVSVKNNDDTWGAPINLGEKINTRFSERYPYLTKDMKTLYFSSDGHGGLGKMDVFRSTRLNENCWDCWSEPENLGIQINGPEDDIEFELSDHQNYYCMTNAERSFASPKEFIFIIAFSQYSNGIYKNNLQNKLTSLFSNLSRSKTNFGVIIPAEECNMSEITVLKPEINLQLINKQIAEPVTKKGNAILDAFQNYIEFSENSQEKNNRTSQIIIITDGFNSSCENLKLQKSEFEKISSSSIPTTIVHLQSNNSVNQWLSELSNATDAKLIQITSEEDIQQTFDLMQASIILSANDHVEKSIRIGQILNNKN